MHTSVVHIQVRTSYLHAEKDFIRKARVWERILHIEAKTGM